MCLNSRVHDTKTNQQAYWLSLEHAWEPVLWLSVSQDNQIINDRNFSFIEGFQLTIDKIRLSFDNLIESVGPGDDC